MRGMESPFRKPPDRLMTPTVAPCGHEAPWRRRESVIRVGDASAFAITIPLELPPSSRWRVGCLLGQR